MSSSRKSRPPSRGFFVHRDVAEERLGRPLQIRISEPSPSPVPRAGSAEHSAPSPTHRSPPVPAVPAVPPVPPVPDAPASPAAAARDARALREAAAARGEITITRPSRRTDPRADPSEATAPARESEVAFGSVSVKRGPPTIPAKSREPAVVAASKAARIIDELGRCGPGAEAAFLEPLRALGEQGLEALRRDFPGLLWFDRHLPHRRTPRGRDVSPIASLLHALGQPAHAPILALLESDDADVRYYAVMLASDVGCLDFLEPLAQRLYDDDAEVVTLAMRALEALGGAPRIARLGVELAEALGTPGAYRRQLRAIELIALLRHPLGLAALVTALDDAEGTLARGAHRALRVLTAHDLGSRSKDWAKFLRSHRDAPRHAWLLEGLVGRDAALRDLAAAELALLVGDAFGYVPGCSAGDARDAKKVFTRRFRP